jgi:glycine cleavage system regulatory protein
VATLVLTVIGDDRAGLVGALAAPIAAHGGNWDHSHMARLAGQFAGIVVVTAPDDRVPALTSALETLHAQGLLDVRVAIAGPDEPADGAMTMTLHLIGQDRPGIIHEVSTALARRGVSIEELQTSTGSAPMSAEALFEATALLRLPVDADVDALQHSLEDIANELMVDLDVSELPTPDDRRSPAGPSPESPPPESPSPERR